MKAVSQDFLDKIKNPTKSVASKLLISWDKTIAEDRAFFTLGESDLDGDDVLWNGNQAVVAFSDRYNYEDESKNLKSWKISRKVSNHPWGVVQSTASFELNNASGKYFEKHVAEEELFVEGVLNNQNGYAIENGELVEVGAGETSFTAYLEIQGGKTYIISKKYLGGDNRLRAGTAASALLDGGALSNVVVRDDYETITISAASSDTILYINYAVNAEDAAKSLETLSVREEVTNAYANLPNRPFKLQVEVGGESVNLFTGYTSRPDISIIGSTYKVEAYDAIAYLSTLTSSLPAQVQKPLHEIIRELLLEAGFVEGQFELEPAIQFAIDFVAPRDRNVVNLLTELCESEQYLLFADGDGIIHGWNANHYEVTDDGADWRVNFDNAKEINWGSSSVLNDVLIDAKPYKLMPVSKFFAMSDATEDYLVPANGSKSIFVDFRDAENNAIYALNFEPPEYDTNLGSSYRTNTKLDESGEDNHFAITLESYANFGDAARLTFANSSSTPTYITDISLVGETAQVREVVGLEAFDEESIANYGLNPDENEGEIYKIESAYIQNETFASQVAERVVRLYASPLVKVEAPIFFAPQLELGDQVLANIGRFGERQMLIFGYELSGDANADYQQRLFLEARPVGRYFTLDVSVLDGDDVLAF